jgi:hypothetical protein
VYGSIRADLEARLVEARATRVYEQELVITTPQSAHVAVDGRSCGALTGRPR